MKATSKWRRPQKWRQPRNEDDLKNEDKLKNEDDLRNENTFLYYYPRGRICTSAFFNAMGVAII